MWLYILEWYFLFVSIISLKTFPDIVMANIHIITLMNKNAKKGLIWMKLSIIPLIKLGVLYNLKWLMKPNIKSDG